MSDVNDRHPFNATVATVRPPLMAAQTPSNDVPNVDPKLTDRLSQDVNEHRAPLHSFDPAASPAEKAATIQNATDKLQSVIPQDNAQPRGLFSTALPYPILDTLAEVQIQDAASTVVPTITIDNADAVGKEPLVTAPPKTDIPTIPGAMPDQPLPAIPDWYRIGWRQVSGVDAKLSEELKEQAVLDSFLSDQFYGSWYHNAAVIVFVSFSCLAMFQT